MFEKRLKGLINLLNSQYKGVMTTQLTVRNLLDIYEIDNNVNRDINYSRLSSLSKYLDSFDTGIGIFLPSFVLAFKEDPINFYDKKTKELVLPQGHKLKVIDGQHRIKGMEYLLKTITNEERKEEVLQSVVTAQIYFGLSDNDQKNVFVDINSNAKRVSMSLITKYDTREIMRVLIRDIYKTCKALQIAGVEFEKSRIVRPGSKLFITSARLKKFITILLFGKVKLSKKNEQILKDNYDDILVFLDKFFEIFFDVLPDEPGNVLKYTLGHEALQNAIALYLHNIIMFDSSENIRWSFNWEQELERLKYFDWTIKNKDFETNMVKNRQGTKYEFYAFIDSKHGNLLEILQQVLGD